MLDGELSELLPGIELCVCNQFYFSCCMRAEGPWQQLWGFLYSQILSQTGRTGHMVPAVLNLEVGWFQKVSKLSARW